MVRITVLSHYRFDEKMKELGLNDKNVEDTNKAFISIIGTPECLTYYLDEGKTKHFFNDHPNVLNLDFDDIEDDVMYYGHQVLRLNYKVPSKMKGEEQVVLRVLLI